MKKSLIALFAVIACVALGAGYTPVTEEADSTISGALAVSGNVTSSALIIETPTTTSVTNGATVTPTASVHILNGIGGANDSTNTVTLASATNGQRLTLIVASASTNLITIADSGNCALSGAWLGDNNDTLELIGVSTNWVEVGETNN